MKSHLYALFFQIASFKQDGSYRIQYFTLVLYHNFITTWPVYIGGLSLITYASRGGGGVNTNAYKCVQGGRGGLNMTKNTHFVRRFIENPTISDTFKLQILPIFSHKIKTKLLTPFKNVISIT